jgi:hypothetical protein
LTAEKKTRFRRFLFRTLHQNKKWSKPRFWHVPGCREVLSGAEVHLGIALSGGVYAQITTSYVSELRAQIEKTDATATLSISVVKKTQQIEKLAKHIKDLATG